MILTLHSKGSSKSSLSEGGRLSRGGALTREGALIEILTLMGGGAKSRKYGKSHFCKNLASRAYYKQKISLTFQKILGESSVNSR